MLRKKNSEPAQLPEARQELLEFESPAAQPGKKDPKQFLKHNWKKITAVVCVAAVAAAVLLPKTSKKDVQASTQYVEAALERRDITNTFSGSGTISAANTYTVKSLVKGTVLTADFEVGDTIEKGTVLYTIDSSDVATSVEKAQLALEQAQRSYDDAADAQYIRSVIGGTVASIKVKAGDYVTAGQEIATVRDDSSLLLTLEFPAADASNFAVGQAAQVMLNGTFETLSGTVQAVAGTDTISSGNLLVRTVTIAVPNNGSLTTAQAASASINGVSALASARFDYQHQQTVTATASGTVSAVCVKEGTVVAANTAIVQLSGTELSRQVQSAADSLLNAQLSMSDTEKQMENYTITSPISGTVIQKNVKAGDTVGTDTASSETLCTIYDLSYLEMTLNVDELEILSIKEGQTVTITADAISDRTFTGVVTSVSAAGTTTGGTTTYPVTIRIDDTGDLLPGMNATAEIEVSSAENALTIPNGAVVRGNYVLVTRDSPSAVNAVQDMTAPDGYVYVKITTGTSDNDSIEVTGGLQEGDTIAYDANAAEKQNASDSMEFMVGPGGTIAYDADAAEKQNASDSGGHGGGNGGPGGRGPGGGF
ncbi:efflux RND transporter periplasmic adaptor subunit [Faecalibacterium wellingii]|uniref:HlyD family efflux transporter periplasmic adaptor subunit n=1 Tax=Faecalibacterium wellingii TaxID=2929491 RepID=A0ABU3TZN0_9FIRM|nr:MULTISPECIES: HlyD family efflux transporter periplasmic adaptor subunit [Faecalibacterium]MDU8688479.1 HlyD family efflux transporter periplasmic adaptor subunit [Faecalibacterium prausnitzii]UQK55532.1 HlyD family efflux transporter periplasmic adaptor subunit [Faecalibacterium sp. HTF-F]